MIIFDKYFMPAISERFAQDIGKFNEASGNTVVLSTEMFEGNTVSESFYAITAANRRVDRYAANGAVANIDLAQAEHKKIKVAGGFGPVSWEPSQMTWLKKPTGEAIQAVAQQASEALLADQLNTVVGCGVAAITNIAGLTNDVSGGAFMTQAALNDTYKLMGDRSQAIKGSLMTGACYHDLVGEALANSASLFTSGNITVIDIQGKRTIISDIPALETAGAPGTYQVLGLQERALTVEGAGDIIFNIDTSNGKERIESTWQSDYTFINGVKGCSWLESAGGVSPVDAELFTGTNWPQDVTSIKDVAGVLTKADRGHA